jgi:hypothetical protein
MDQRSWHDIQGFNFESIVDGRRLVSIEADRCSIEKKKLGFFRLALMSTIRLENARIDIYGRPGQLHTEAAHSPTKVELPKELISSDLFPQEIFPSSVQKAVTSIEAEPITLRLHYEDSVATKITAISALLRVDRRDILFKGNVRVVSGPRVLITDRLTILPDKGVLNTSHQFIMQIGETQTAGWQLSTDFLLNPLSPTGKDHVQQRGVFQERLRG